MWARGAGRGVGWTPVCVWWGPHWCYSSPGGSIQRESHSIIPAVPLADWSPHATMLASLYRAGTGLRILASGGRVAFKRWLAIIYNTAGQVLIQPNLVPISPVSFDFFNLDLSWHICFFFLAARSNLCTHLPPRNPISHPRPSTFDQWVPIERLYRSTSSLCPCVPGRSGFQRPRINMLAFTAPRYSSRQAVKIIEMLKKQKLQVLMISLWNLHRLCWDRHKIKSLSLSFWWIRLFEKTQQEVRVGQEDILHEEKTKKLKIDKGIMIMTNIYENKSPSIWI